MTQRQTAGIVLVIGFLIYILAMLLAPPRLYQEPAIEGRLRLIAAHPSRWYWSQLSFALGILIPVGGLVLFSLQLDGSANRWLSNLAAGAVLIGALAGVLFVYRQTLDPAPFWNSSQPIRPILIYLLLTLSGLALYGLLFLQDGLPAWLAILTSGAAIALLAAYLLSRGSGAFFVSVLAYVICLVAGVVMWRS